MDFLQVLVTGTLFGGIYVLLSVPLNLIFGTMRVLHFAYGQFLMMAMFGALFLSKGAHIGPYEGGFVIVGLGSAVAGVLSYYLIFKWIVYKHFTTQIVGTLAIGLVLENISLHFWGANVQSIQTPISNSSVHFGGIFLETVPLVAFGAAIVSGIGLMLFLKYSRWGRAAAAISQSRMGAEIVGIPLERVYLIIIAVATGLIGITGSFLLPMFPVNPQIGSDFIVIAFVVVVLGGMGSIAGSILAGLVVGIAQSLSATYIGVEWQSITYFVVFVIVLVIRPAGIAGVRGAEELGHV